MRVCVRVAAVFDHGARAGLLQPDAAGIDFDGARERCDSFIALARLRFRSRDTRLHGAIVRIYFGRAQQSRKIAFVSAQREVQLIEAAPEKEQPRKRNPQKPARIERAAKAWRGMRSREGAGAEFLESRDALPPRSTSSDETRESRSFQSAPSRMK